MIKSPRRPARAIALARSQDRNRKAGTALGALALGIGLIATQVFGESHEEASATSDENIIISHGFNTFGELQYPEGFEHFDYVNPDAPKGGEIAQAVVGSFDSLNPYARKGDPGGTVALTTERMMFVEVADDAYGYYCLLCEKIEYPESQDWIIFHLRDDVTFSDGTPMTAEDVVFTVDLFLEQGLPSFAQSVRTYFESYEVLDERRVKYTFAEGVDRKALIPQAGAFPVFSKAFFEENDRRLDESYLTEIMGTGPYTITEVEAGRRIVYERREDYWGWDHPVNAGRHNFDRIRLEYFADNTAAFEAFKSGVVNFRVESNSLTWATQYDFPALDNEWVTKTELPNGLLPNAVGILYNLRRPLFQDIRVREALGLMYNFTWTNETLQYGLLKQRHSFWENTDLAATGVPEGEELALLESVADMIDPSILTEPAVMAHESGERQLDRGNLRRASALLDEAGWIVGDDGIRRKDGETLSVEFLEDSPTLDRIINPYIQNLQRLGVDATYNRVDPAQYSNRRNEFDYDIILSGYINGLAEARGLGQRYGSDRAEISIFNPAGYSSPAVDKLIEDVIAAKTEEEMKIGVRAIDRIMRAERFVTPTWYNDQHWVAYYNMFEHPEIPPYALGQLDFWWFNEDRYEELEAAGAF
ncbi:extracellular solute-binding protein [Aestuariibius insulae]|uniref:extracellular solute-binding protein n=1 Tax=Aestuariibius insulae TaxID=2058287 RepID=UPI00345EB56F